MKIFCVRIGNKYGPEYETYINSKLSEYEIIWIREPFDSRIQLQWNKMYPMSLDLDEPVVVMDIDVILTNNYEKVFDYPISRGEFLASPNWWNSEIQNFNGGFFKYYPVDCNYIFEEFMSKPIHWQRHFISIGAAKGPVNGEQNFVRQMVLQKLKLKILPSAWFTRWTSIKWHDINPYDDAFTSSVNWESEMELKYEAVSGNKYIFDGNQFHPDIKIVHFTHSLNKPLDWNRCENFYGINRNDKTRLR